MRITFKNVGQGDSILLEWKDGRGKHIGIIDCKKEGWINPVLESLRAGEYTEIAFIALSHPHYDHFSGLLELLEYCDTNNIKIRRFVHTARLDARYILDSANSDNTHKELFRRILIKIDELYNQKKIIDRIYAELDWAINLTEDRSIEIRLLAPSEEAIKEYIKIVNREHGINAQKCSRAANYLSSIFVISTKDDALFLTSDATIEAFDHIKERYPEQFEKRLVLCQVPHHGSRNNHKISFWKAFDKRFLCPAVISAGKNTKYKHPDYEVVKDFYDNDFRVYSTNNVNGMEDFNEEHIAERVERLNRKLDTDSIVVKPYNQEGDKVFEFKNGILKYIAH